MVGIPETSMGDLLEIMKQRQSSLKKEDKPCQKTNTIIPLLELAIKNGEKEKQKAPHIETNSASSSSRNADSRPVATEPSVSFNNNDLLNHNRSSRPTATVSSISTNEIPKVVTTPNVEEDKPKPSGKVDSKPASPIPTKKTNVGSTTTPSGDNKPHNFIGSQFYMLNGKETKYKESKENFHISLRNNVIGVVITGLFIAAAVMVPSIAGAVVCGIVAALALVATRIHVKDSTLSSYKEMEENRVERVAKTVQFVI